MEIAMIAPPWIPVPAPTYGGIETVIDILCWQLWDKGHKVTLFCSPGSKAKAELVHNLDHAYPGKIGSSMYETDHVLQSLTYVKEWAGRYQVIHDHTTMAVALAKYCKTPMVHTMHNGHAGDRGAFYKRHGKDALLVAISQAQKATAPKSLNPFVVPNPIDTEAWPYRENKMPYALWVGRFDPVKGAHRAIRAAKIAGVRLILAGPVQPGQEHYFEQRVKPFIDDDKIKYVGEVGGVRKKNLFANAACLLMPIRWNEPFGMVMGEALACGTPVIAFPYGAATEIVIDGVNGHHVADTSAMAEALLDLGDIKPADCRESVERYSPSRVADLYLDVYQEVA